jgi:hypothetical protein
LNEKLSEKSTAADFILDLGSMCDVLQGLFDLSLDLQEGDMDMYRANKK